MCGSNSGFLDCAPSELYLLHDGPLFQTQIRFLALHLKMASGDFNTKPKTALIRKRNRLFGVSDSKDYDTLFRSLGRLNCSSILLGVEKQYLSIL